MEPFMKKVFMDHASASPVRKEAIEAMLPYFDRDFGNPSAVYDLGLRAKDVIEAQREKVAKLIGARADQIIFTSSGSEANNLAIKGAALARQDNGNHIIVSAIEHHSVLNSVKFLERMNFEVTPLPVDEYGFVDPERLSKAITSKTILASIMHASNEIGTIEPISEYASVCREKEVLFHTDAIATAGNIPVHTGDLNVDLLSLSGCSLRAPKGVGALYFREHIRLTPLIHGGVQESGRRAGTENVPAIVGLGKASELAAEEVPHKEDAVSKLRDRLIADVCGRIDAVKLTGHPERRLPGHASFCFEAIEGEALLLMLDQEKIYANTGSACASKDFQTSHVLKAVGVPGDLAQGSIVFTLDSGNVLEEIEIVLEKLSTSVERLRSLSPIWRRKSGS